MLHFAIRFLINWLCSSDFIIIITSSNGSCNNHCCPTGHHTPLCLTLDEVRYCLSLSRFTFLYLSCCFFTSLFSSPEERGPPVKHVDREEGQILWRRWDTGSHLLLTHPLLRHTEELTWGHNTRPQETSSCFLSNLPSLLLQPCRCESLYISVSVFS